MPNKTIIRLNFKSIRISSFCFVLLCSKDEIQFWWGYGKSVTFVYCWWFCNLIHPFKKQFGSIKKPLKSWFHVTQECYSYTVSPESCPAWPPPQRLRSHLRHLYYTLISRPASQRQGLCTRLCISSPTPSSYTVGIESTLTEWVQIRKEDRNEQGHHGRTVIFLKMFNLQRCNGKCIY